MSTKTSKSRLTARERAIVTRAIVAEYRWLGVIPAAVAPEVALGRWDDHPVAVRLLAARTGEPAAATGREHGARQRRSRP